MERAGTGCAAEGKTASMKEKKELEIGHAQQADSMEEEVPEDTGNEHDHE